MRTLSQAGAPTVCAAMKIGPVQVRSDAGLIRFGSRRVEASPGSQDIVLKSVHTRAGFLKRGRENTATGQRVNRR